MKRHIFVINGSGGVGKDTFCKFVEDKGTWVLNVSSVDIIKEIARDIGWNGEKNPKDRKMLSDLKSLAVEYSDAPMNYIKQCVEKFNSTPYYKDKPKVLFIHIREPQEIKRVVEEFGAKTILITNSNVEAITSNQSDAQVMNYDYDFIIDNSGTLEDLRKTVYNFCEEYIEAF